MSSQLIIAFVAGLLIGGIIIYLIVKMQLTTRNSTEVSEKVNEINALKSELKYEGERSKGLMKDLEGINKDLKEERQKLLTASVANSKLKVKYESLEEKLTVQKDQVRELQQQFAVQFKNLANDIFEANTRKFTDQNKSNIDDLLKPLGEKIAQFEKKVENTNKDSIARNAALKEQIINLRELNHQITKEAKNLTDALRVDNKLQGSWGEIQLENILQSAGLQREIHYFKERNLKNEFNENQRPDYIVKLPDDKNVVIDSKVSLLAYANYLATEDEQEQLAFLSQHVASIQNHIKNLSGKNYQNLHSISQPDYVLMFLANEAALIAALQANDGLYETALSRNIVIVTSTTLMATLKTISYIWKHDLQNKNALEIARQAGTLYDKFVAFSEDLSRVGSQLQTTQNSYQEAMRKLVEGRDNLIRKTERLKELGAKTSKALDQKLIDQSDLDS
ncbi:MAG: DNA recombination protein RmuC [Bacteroidota bacterium]